MAPLSRRRQQPQQQQQATGAKFTLSARPLTGTRWHHGEGDKRVVSSLDLLESRVEAKQQQQQQFGRQQAKQNDYENNRNDNDDEMKTTQRENASETEFACYLNRQKPEPLRATTTTKCQSKAAAADCCREAAASAYCCRRCCCAPSCKSQCAAVAVARVRRRQLASKMMRSTIKSAAAQPAAATAATECISANTRISQNASDSTLSSSIGKREISQERQTTTETGDRRREVAPRPEVRDEMSRQQQEQTRMRRRRYGTARTCSDYDELTSRRLKPDDSTPAEISPLTSEDDDDGESGERNRSPVPTANRWSRHSAGCTSASLSSASSPSLNSLSSVNSLALEQFAGTTSPRLGQGQKPVTTTTTTKFSQLTSGAGSASVSAIPSGTGRPGKRRPAPLPPKTAPARRSQSVSDVHQQHQQQQHEATQSGHSTSASDLLSEQEVHAIEHFLRSHKSSVYVCGCMANLYFTKTHLADNGRTSRAATGEWKLNKTGVPVLIFDSGLAKNRQKKRLSISLTERGSGFVLWSDTIDHLSNYRAFSPSLHSIEGGTGSRTHQPVADTCDSFHVMYLSSYHRIMVGLSFDNPLCARLFLAQIELVCSDPSNIALTGPKNHLLATAASSALVGPPATGAKLTYSLSSGALATTTTTATTTGRQRRGLASKLNLFGLASARTRTTSGQVNQSITGTSGGGWSTLKRAARLGGGGRAGAASGSGPAAASGDVQVVAARDQQCRDLLEAFKPRPLAQLAAEGKVWSHKTSTRRSQAVKKIPRKCDISAPCLFQHVISVDQANLDQLYSKSFVLESQLERRRRHHHHRSSGCGSTVTSGLQVPRVTEPQPEVISSTDSTDQKEPEGASGGGSKERISSQTKEQVVATTAKCSLSISSSSSPSCYSSGSSTSSAAISCAPVSASRSSPTSSGSDSDRDRLSANSGQQQPNRGLRHAQLGLRATRPLVAPPKPPQREATCVAQSTFGKPCARTGGGTKINSILSELQSQVASDLVDAKRRLMADIANRVGGGGGGVGGIQRTSAPGNQAADHHHRSAPKTSISRL